MSSVKQKNMPKVHYIHTNRATSTMTARSHTKKASGDCLQGCVRNNCMVPLQY